MTKEIKDILGMPVKNIRGIGDARAALLNKIGIYSIEDAVTYYPRDYQDRGKIKLICELSDGDECSFEGIISGKVLESRPRKGLTIQKANIVDDTGVIKATWFNQSFIKKVFTDGERYVFFGKINKKYNNLEIQNPVYEKAGAAELKNTCRIIPIYSSTANLTQTVIRAAIRNALLLVSGRLNEIIPKYIRDKYFLSDINYAIENIHFPKSDEDFNRARYRLVFEELFLLQIGLLSIKQSLMEQDRGISFKKVDEVYTFIKGLPFKLTEAQERVFSEIEKDMEDERIMNRLIQGDVGSGKTIVAVLAMLKAVKSGYQAAMMVPTEILAQQHYASICELLKKCGVKVDILTGGQSRDIKKEILERISDGTIDIVIGTHALIEEGVNFRKLGLVVTDEQHRFGVRQRNILSKKGNNPDVLVMTATPIPRTLALILYGDMDISSINQLPPGRKPVKTYSVGKNMRDRVNSFIRKKVLEGQQVYIVCPLVEESEAINAKSALDTARSLSAKEFRDLKVGLIHGKMRAKDKEAVMKEFARDGIDILVSTTVIEVGMNVPNAAVMVVENAERFGLAQLHQLRGRVGRGREQAYCILYNESKSELAKERMKVLEETNDGFIISEKDLLLRGPGDFFGTRQHGIPELKIANLYRDIEILKIAQQAALDILEQDRHLEMEEHLKLADMLKKLRIWREFTY